MALAARDAGYEYLAITDHSASFGFGDEVSPDAAARADRPDPSDSTSTASSCWPASEVNILPDGTLDYDDELLAELDWVIAWVHSSFRMTADADDRAHVRAIEHPLVDAIGHPTGRKLERRAPYAFDIDRVIEAAAAHRDDARDQLQPGPPRPERDQCSRRGRAPACRS